MFLFPVVPLFQCPILLLSRCPVVLLFCFPLVSLSCCPVVLLICLSVSPYVCLISHKRQSWQIIDLRSLISISMELAHLKHPERCILWGYFTVTIITTQSCKTNPSVWGVMGRQGVFVGALQLPSFNSLSLGFDNITASQALLLLIDESHVGTDADIFSACSKQSRYKLKNVFFPLASFMTHFVPVEPSSLFKVQHLIVVHWFDLF